MYPIQLCPTPTNTKTIEKRFWLKMLPPAPLSSKNKFQKQNRKTCGIKNVSMLNLFKFGVFSFSHSLTHGQSWV